MKTSFYRIFLSVTFFIILSALNATIKAYDLYIGGIYYDKNGTNLTVTRKGNGIQSYSGNVVIPETVSYGGIVYSVTAIGNYAFSTCTNLYSVTIGGNVQTIGRMAFNKCENLVSVRIPESLTKIDYEAFFYCESLASITIPKSVNHIGDGAFSGCSSLKTLFFNAESCLADGTGSNFGSSLENVYIGDGVKRIPDYFVYQNKITKITIPKSVIYIGQKAFAKCQSLKTLYYYAEQCSDFSSGTSSPFYDCIIDNVIVGSDVKRIPAYFMSENDRITNVTIPYLVTEIGASAFYKCTGLTNIRIPNSNSTVGKSAFSGCSNIISIQLPTLLTTIEDYTFNGCSKLANITIPNTVTSIGNYAFGNCTSLSDITIPNSVTSIGQCAFSGCTGLTKFTIPSAVTSLGNSVFSNCTNLSKVYVLRSTPPSCSSTTFPSNQLIYVPIASVYQNSYYWKTYNIHGMYSISPQVTLATITSDESFRLSKAILKDSNGQSVKTYNSWNNVISVTDLLPNSTNDVDVCVVIDNKEYSIPNQVATKLTFSRCNSAATTQTSLTPEFTVSRDEGFVLEDCGVTMFSIRDYPGSIVSFSENEYKISCGKIGDLSINTTYNFRPWVKYKGEKYYGDEVKLYTSSAYIYKNISLGPTHVRMSASYNAGDAQVTQSYFNFNGYYDEVIVKTGLEPSKDYDYYYMLVTTNGQQISSGTIRTYSLQMTAKAADMITNKDARLMAETNMADIETSCGFEWRRYDAPEEMPSTKVYCPVYGGVMAGTLKNLSENVYYKYRPFYKSSAGNEYYGDWIAFITADAGVEFEPVVYTYDAPAVTQTDATLQGVALRGSEEITSQGFEYWQASKNNTLTASNNVTRVTAKGERMNKTVSDLQPGTKYRFRAFVTAGGETTYGKEVEFVTLSSSLDVNLDGEVNIADVNSVIDLIMVSGGVNTGDVNGDGEINIADINTLIDAILSK